jgi:hypothetical protein
MLEPQVDYRCWLPDCRTNIEPRSRERPKDLIPGLEALETPLAVRQKCEE